MKTDKKLLTISLLFCVLVICLLACVFTACGNKTPVTGITLNRSYKTIMQGQSFKLVADVQPSDATDKRVKYSVTQTANFVSVSDDGTVTALAVGVASVTATTHNGKFSASCSVAVIPLAPTGIELDKTSIVLDRDESYKLKATINPYGAPATVIFASDKPTVATVEPDGTVTAKSPGETVVKAYVGSYDGAIIAECAVRVGYKIIVKKEGSGDVTYKNDCYYSGSSVSLTVTAQKGYLFDGWYENDTRLSSATSYSYKVAGDAVITVKFVEDPDAPKKNVQGYYEIKTHKNLIWASAYQNDNFILKNNITTDSSFKGFKYFYGIFDGNGYTISNFSADSGYESGFFASLNGTVKNLTLKNAESIGTNSDAGLLVGLATNATIENCHVQGSVKIEYMSHNYTAGGLVGLANGNTVITHCSADVTATIDSYNKGDFGGLVGYASSCQISFCSANINTDVKFRWDDQDFGGLIGCVNYASAVTDCYTTGNITVNIPKTGYNENSIYVGGAIGLNYGTAQKCYSAVDIDLSGDATMSAGRVSGFCGYNDGTIDQSLYCGHFNASGNVASCARAFTYGGKTTVWDFYVPDWVNFEVNESPTRVIYAQYLTNDFFNSSLEFQERYENDWIFFDGWIFEENKLPHF